MVGVDQSDGLKVGRCRQCSDVPVCAAAGGIGDDDFIHGEQELQGPSIPTAV